MNIVLTADDFEQGAIWDKTGENVPDNNYIRTKNRIPLPDIDNLKFTVESVSGKSLLTWLYVFNGTEFKTFGWYDSPFVLDLYNINKNALRLVIQYNTGGNINPKDIKSVKIEFDYSWEHKNGIPIPKANPNLPTDYSFPNARWTWRYSADGTPCNGFMPISEPAEPKGAFRNCSNLERVYIPESVKYIGEEAFAGTALKTVKIAADCEYSSTSFPEGCIVEFYGGGGDYGQLYDCNGYAVLDREAARIYVKESDKNG